MLPCSLPIQDPGAWQLISSRLSRSFWTLHVYQSTRCFRNAKTATDCLTGLSFCHAVWHASLLGGRTGLLYTSVLAEARQDSSFRSLIDQMWRIHCCSIKKMWQNYQTTYLSLPVPLYITCCHFTGTSVRNFLFVNPISSHFWTKMHLWREGCKGRDSMAQYRAMENWPSSVKTENKQEK